MIIILFTVCCWNVHVTEQLHPSHSFRCAVDLQRWMLMSRSSTVSFSLQRLVTLTHCVLIGCWSAGSTPAHGSSETVSQPLSSALLSTCNQENLQNAHVTQKNTWSVLRLTDDEDEHVKHIHLCSRVQSFILKHNELFLLMNYDNTKDLSRAQTKLKRVTITFYYFYSKAETRGENSEKLWGPQFELVRCLWKRFCGVWCSQMVWRSEVGGEQREWRCWKRLLKEQLQLRHWSADSCSYRWDYQRLTLLIGLMFPK